LDDAEGELAVAKSFQAQAMNIQNLMDGHVRWDLLIDEISQTTYKFSKTFRINMETTGKIHIEGITNSYTDLGKLLLAFETSDDYTAVDLLSSTQSTTLTSGIIYSIDIFVDQNIFVRQN
jgi:hypothetical protein